MRAAPRSQAAEAGGRFALPVSTPPMEALTAAALPAGGAWQYEPKWDGFRCLAFKFQGDVDLRAKSGKPLARYFPEMCEMLSRVAVPQFVLDGELVIELATGFSFEALQMRLHPADSRVRRLAAETPACLVAFDLLAGADGASLLDQQLCVRRAALEALFDTIDVPGRLILSPATRDPAVAAAWVAESGAGALDGVVAKRLDGAYAAGERAMVKVKRQRTADCVVGGFRYLAARREVGSLLLGLYGADGKLNHVGFTATLPAEQRSSLTQRLEELREPPGFTGRAPGGPSRWSTERSVAWVPLRPELVVEVRFDQVTGERFRHGTTLMRWRPDKAPAQCTMEQLHGAEPSAPRSVHEA